MIIATHGIVASQILTVPVATAATSVGDSSFTANWNAYSGANYYLLDVSLNSSFSSFVGAYQNYVVISNSQVVSGLSSNTTYYYRVRAVTGVDTDAAAFISRVYTAGGVLTYTEVTATEQLVTDLKGYSIWSKMKAIYPMVGASSAACAQNLKSSSFTGTFFGGWTYASTGATPNGTTGYMDTGFNPSTQLTTNNAHLSYYSRTQPTSTTNYFVEIGSSNTAIGAQGANYLQLYLKRLVQSNQAAFECNNWNSGIQAAFSNSDSRCMVIGSRTSSTSNKIYRNGISQNTATSTNTSVNPNFNTYIGASNAAGTASNFSELQCAFSSIGDGLTDTEASNLYTAVNAFQVSLSRNV